MVKKMPDSENSKKKVASCPEENKGQQNRQLDVEEIADKLVQLKKAAIYNEIIGGFAHELNQPLNSIRIICQSSLRDIQKDRFSLKDLAPDLIEMIQHVDKMAENIDNLRGYACQSKRIPDEKTDINQTIQTVFDLIGQQLTNRRIDVELALDPELPHITINAYDLEQVFVNVIVNARNAVENTEKDQKKIAVKTFKPVEENGIVIEISDNGIGISENHRKLIFQPFFSTEETEIGLGLYTSQKILAKYNGQIHVESKIGMGSTFRIILKN